MTISGKERVVAVEENKEIVLRWTKKGFEEGNVAIADEIVAADFVNRTPAPGQVPGREGLKQAVAMLRGAFPDIHVLVQEVIAEGDKVVIRDRIEATHQGPFMGIPATGRPVSVDRIAIYRLEDGKIAEHWANIDMAGLMRQLGLLQGPAAS
jgi:steroid delta-isomerase-like uncharacterized protein